MDRKIYIFHFWVLFVRLCCAFLADAKHGDVVSLIKQDGAVVTLIEAYGRDSLRVRIGTEIVKDYPGGLIAINPASYAQNVIVNSPNSIANGNLRADIGDDGLLTFTRISDSKVLFAEISRTFTPLANYDNAYVLNASYSSDANEAIYGLGQHKTGRLNYKGLSFDFKSCLEYKKSFGSEVLIPWIVSNRGYGFLWNLPSFGDVHFYSDNTTWSSTNTPQVDIWVTTSTPDSSQVTGDILSNFVDVTGHAPKFPYFATGFWQSKNRYRTQTEILDVAEGYIERGLPLSVIVIDWYHWTNLGDFRFNPNCWPDPLQLSTELGKVGVNIMVSVWPLIDNSSVNFQTLKNNGYLVKCPPNDLCHQGSYLYDPTNPRARAFIFEQVQKGYISNGIKIFWLDADEPELQDPIPPYIYSIGPDTAVGMIYPLYHQTTFHDGLTALGETEILFFSRSAWVGSQRLGTVVWSGDVPSTFESLQQQVRVGLNMGLSGIVWWTTDIGGYSGGNITSPEWRELVVRWFQWGAFCPLFRIHGDRIPGEPDDKTCGFAGGSNEVWQFGDEAYAAIRTVMNIREQLRPYVAQQMEIASLNGTPVIRPLWFDFPNDPLVANIEDQFMFGPDFMVAPVLFYNARSRSVYFPSGARWVHWFSKNVYEGGTSVWLFPAPLNEFPVFIRV